MLARFASEGGLLLATDAASEGLNLQSRCRLVVHFELPWNPMRLEQRVGRVDRLGQAQRVHEVLLVARHTAERLVLAPLVRRLVTAQRAPTLYTIPKGHKEILKEQKYPTPAELNPAVPEEISSLVMSCLRYRPHERPTRMEDVLRVLEGYRPA